MEIKINEKKNCAKPPEKIFDQRSAALSHRERLDQICEKDYFSLGSNLTFLYPSQKTSIPSYTHTSFFNSSPSVLTSKF
jgi:hypothetical protein